MEFNRQNAKRALEEASKSNPGAWTDHSRYVAEACKNIARGCKNLSAEQAYLFGLLHDIGRYAGISSERHLIDGYRYCMERGWEKVAHNRLEAAYNGWEAAHNGEIQKGGFIMKAVFIDYTGTITKEDSPIIRKILMRFCQNSNQKDPKKMMAYWWELLRKYEWESYQDAFRTEDEIVDLMLWDCQRELGLTDHLAELHSMVQESWSNSPFFEDVADFFHTCPCPVYIVTNNGAEYVEAAMEAHQLKPAGIVCGDMARAYKPRPEIFQKALEISGCQPKEVLHVGDSLQSDIAGAAGAGIRAVLLDRTGEKKETGCPVIRSLRELF